MNCMSGMIRVQSHEEVGYQERSSGAEKSLPVEFLAPFVLEKKGIGGIK